VTTSVSYCVMIQPSFGAREDRSVVVGTQARRVLIADPGYSVRTAYDDRELLRMIRP